MMMKKELSQSSDLKVGKELRGKIRKTGKIKLGSKRGGEFSESMISE